MNEGSKIRMKLRTRYACLIIPHREEIIWHRRGAEGERNEGHYNQGGAGNNIAAYGGVKQQYIRIRMYFRGDIPSLLQPITFYHRSASVVLRVADKNKYLLSGMQPCHRTLTEP